MKSVTVVIVLMALLHAGGIILPDHFKASFTQKITNPEKRSIHYSGKVAFSAPSRLKWNYRKPTRKEVCTDSETLTVVDHDLEQVSSYLISQGFNLNEIIKQAKRHSDRIYIAHYQGKSYTIQIDKKARLQSVAYYDELDNKVQIVFKDMQYGKGALKKKEMVCHVPGDYDRIRG